MAAVQSTNDNKDDNEETGTYHAIGMINITILKCRHNIKSNKDSVCL